MWYLALKVCCTSLRAFCRSICRIYIALLWPRFPSNIHLNSIRLMWRGGSTPPAERHNLRLNTPTAYSQPKGNAIGWGAALAADWGDQLIVNWTQDGSGRILSVTWSSIQKWTGLIRDEKDASQSSSLFKSRIFP